MFGLPIEFLHAIKKLPANEQGTVHAALWEYAELGEEPAELSPMAEVIFVLAKCWIDRERKMQAESRENDGGMTARECGKLGGRPRKSKPEEPVSGILETHFEESETPFKPLSENEKGVLDNGNPLKTPFENGETPFKPLFEQEKETEKENKKERSKERNKEKDKEKEYKGQGQEINSLFVSYAPAREEQSLEEPKPGGIDYHGLSLTDNNKRVLTDLLGEECAQMALDTAARDKPTAIAEGRYRDDYRLVLDSIPREGAAKYA